MEVTRSVSWPFSILLPRLTLSCICPPSGSSIPDDARSMRTPFFASFTSSSSVQLPGST